MPDKYEFTHEELVDLIHEAVMQDRNERDKAKIEKVIDAEDIESPAYNTTRLYLTDGKAIETFVNDAQANAGLGKQERWGVRDTPIRGADVRDLLRKLSNAAMLAPTNNKIPYGRRHEAQKLYRELVKVWSKYFTATIEHVQESNEALK